MVWGRHQRCEPQTNDRQSASKQIAWIDGVQAHTHTHIELRTHIPSCLWDNTQSQQDIPRECQNLKTALEAYSTYYVKAFSSEDIIMLVVIV